MKGSVNAITIVLLYALFCLCGYVDTFGSNLSCYEIDASSSSFIMYYTRDQLIEIRNLCHNNPNNYVSVLKKNGLFKHQGPRGCRSGFQTKNKIHTIPSVQCSSSVTQCRSSVARSQTTSKTQNEISCGVNASNLIKVGITKHCPSRCENKISLCLVNAQSLNDKTQDFMDYIIGMRSDLCIITETFLTDLSVVTRAALQPVGYLFTDQPRLSGEARGGTGLLYRDCFKATKTSYGQKSSFEYSEYLVTWSNKRLKLCIIYHQPYSQSHPVTNGTF